MKKILIANRGEIACRIIECCKKLNIQTVAVYSDADKNSKHVRLADEKIHIGPSKAKDSYLSSTKILDAALQSKADAVHPGYGFLSENAKFAKNIEKQGATWIGPPILAINSMGDKIEARKIAKENGLPVIEGSENSILSVDEAKKVCNKIGYPVLIKAAGGGGGKGM